MENNNLKLELLVQQVAEAVLTTTETIDRLAARIDVLVTQVEAQGQQLHEQSYQILVLGESVQSLLEIHQESIQPLVELTESLKKIVEVIELPDNNQSSS